MTIPFVFPIAVPAGDSAGPSGAPPPAVRAADTPPPPSDGSGAATGIAPQFAAALANFMMPGPTIAPAAEPAATGGEQTSPDARFPTADAVRAAIAHRTGAPEGYVPLASLFDAEPLQGLELGDVTVESVTAQPATRWDARPMFPPANGARPEKMMAVPDPATGMFPDASSAAATIAPAASSTSSAPTAPTVASEPTGAAMPAVVTEPTAPTVAPPAPAPAAAGAVDRSLSALHPEFRQKLQAVITRMQTEYGYQVDVNETYRSQARQDQLFAQGRTAPGPVVTWTEHSLHSQGLAADLTITGGSSADPMQANRQLALVAQQEGLRTLGPRDPDHVELARDSSPPLPRVVVARSAPVVYTGLRTAAAPDVAASAPVPTASITGPASMARVAPVASVARVAAVAQVAAVARVDVPGAPAPIRAPAVPADPGSAGRPETAAPSAAVAPVASTPSRDGQAPSHDDTRQRDGTADGRHTDATDAAKAAAPAPAPSTSAAAFSPTNATATPPSAIRPTEAHEHTSIGAQIARVDAVNAAAAAQPMSQVVLRFDNASGGTDRIRVGLRDGSVQADVGTGDAALSQRLTDDLAQLRDTLQQQGLDVGTLRVHSDVAGMHADIAASHAAAAADAALSTASAGTSSNGDPSRNAPNRRSDGSPSDQTRRQGGNPGRRQQQHQRGDQAS